MIKRISEAVSKLLFCVKVSNDLPSFLKLVWFTKQYAWQKNSDSRSLAFEEKPVAYRVRLHQQQYVIYLRSFSGDVDIFYEMLWNRVYELPGSVMRKARVIVDLGSNIGMSAFYFLNQCPEACIYCIEPETSNFNLLLKNLDLQIRNGRVIPLQAAVDALDGQGSLQITGLKYNTRLLAGEENIHTVRTISMNSLFTEYGMQRIDILKMDIEGSERRIFTSDTSWLGKVDCIVIEFHSEEDRKICLEVLISRGFSMHSIRRGNSEEGFLFWGKKEKG